MQEAHHRYVLGNAKYYHSNTWPFTPKNQYAYPLHWPLYIPMENSFNNQELLLLVIISFILMTFMCDSGVIL